jgi:transposase
MRRPAKIEDWLTAEQMSDWLKNAPDESARKRRMAIWLIFSKHFYAKDVAEIVGVSVQSVWLWTKQYNLKGPQGLERKGRGGRRWALLPKEHEARILEPFFQRIRSGDVVRAREIKGILEQELGRKVSIPYVYRLLSRHGWSQIIAQSQVYKISTADDFRKLSRPWLREE